jgi:hypothetical protein
VPHKYKSLPLVYTAHTNTEVYVGLQMQYLVYSADNIQIHTYGHNILATIFNTALHEYPVKGFGIERRDRQKDKHIL